MNNFIENIVIGSGPSGFSAILGLLSKGKRPTVISSKNLTQDLLNLQKTWEKPAISKKEDKFNNIFSYDSKSFKVLRPNSDIHLTQSWGGLSNVWGTGINHYTNWIWAKPQIMLKKIGRMHFPKF